MSLSVEELVHMRTSKHYLAKDLSKPSSESIADQVEAFLNRGGRIHHIPQGVTNDKKLMPPPNRKDKAFMDGLARGNKNSHIGRHMGITEAARLIGVTHAWLGEQCDRKRGPYFTYDTGKQGRRIFTEADVLAWNRQRLEDEKV